MHTLGGLIQSNFRTPNCDYDILLRVARRLTQDHRVVVEGVRRMVFNVVAHNRDDHVKNFAFLMDARGDWRMSPAYDLSASSGPGGEHTMTIDGEGREPTLEKVVDLATRHGLKRSETLAIVDRVHQAVEMWPTIAQESGCPDDQVRAIAQTHRFLRARS
jgi:serine/threonine-protein kinase HipA